MVVQGIGGTTGKALALSLIGGAVYGVIKLVKLVTDDARVGQGSGEDAQQPVRSA